MQVAFYWDDYHLHVFEAVCGEFGRPPAGVTVTSMSAAVRGPLAGGGRW
jgi:hypothetical protein